MYVPEVRPWLKGGEVCRRPPPWHQACGGGWGKERRGAVSRKLLAATSVLTSWWTPHQSWKTRSREKQRRETGSQATELSQSWVLLSTWQKSKRGGPGGFSGTGLHSRLWGFEARPSGVVGASYRDNLCSTLRLGRMSESAPKHSQLQTNTDALNSTFTWNSGVPPCLPLCSYPYPFHLPLGQMLIQ